MENFIWVGSLLQSCECHSHDFLWNVLDVLLGMSDVSISRYSLYERSFSVSLSHGIRISLDEISGRGPVRRRGIRLSEAERGESVSQWVSVLSPRSCQSLSSLSISCFTKPFLHCLSFLTNLQDFTLVLTLWWKYYFVLTVLWLVVNKYCNHNTLIVFIQHSVRVMYCTYKIVLFFGFYC